MIGAVFKYKRAILRFDYEFSLLVDTIQTSEHVVESLNRSFVFK